MNYFEQYSEITAELIDSLLEDAYEDDVIFDNLLSDIQDYIIEDIIDEVNLLEEEKLIYLDQPNKIEEHPAAFLRVKELENKISQKYLEQLWIGYKVITEQALCKAYRNSMFKTFEIFSTFNKHYNDMTSQLSAQAKIQITDTYIINTILPIPWCQDGKVYSQRIYGHMAQFQQKLNYVLEEGIRNGKGQEWMIWAWQKLSQTTASEAARLIKTETVAMWSQATKTAYQQMGIEYVEIIGDAACGAICTDYVGDVLLLSDAELGDELPPYHPNCACSYIAYTDVSPEEDDLEYGYEEVDDE